MRSPSSNFEHIFVYVKKCKKNDKPQQNHGIKIKVIQIPVRKNHV